MQKINSAAGLKQAVTQLQNQQAAEEKVLKEQLLTAYESIKPVNLLKSTLKQVGASQHLKDSLITTSAGIVAGYLSEKLFVGKSHGPLKKLLGSALMFGITNVIVKNPAAVKTAGQGLVKIIGAAAHKFSAPTHNPVL